MEKIFDLIFIDHHKSNTTIDLSNYINEYLKENYDLKLIKKKFIIDYEIFIYSNTNENITYNHNNQSNILKINNKKRIIEQYKEISFNNIINIFSIKIHHQDLKIIQHQSISILLTIYLLSSLISYGIQIININETNFIDFIHNNINIITSIYDIKKNIDINKEIYLITIIDKLIIKLMKFITFIIQNIDLYNDNIIKTTLDLFYQVISQEENLNDKIIMKIIKYQINILNKSIKFININDLSKISNSLILSIEEIIKIYPNYDHYIHIIEELVTKILLSIDNLLFELYINNSITIINRENCYIKTGLLIKLLHSILNMLFNNAIILKQLIDSGNMNNIIHFIILNRTLGIEYYDNDLYYNKLQINKSFQEYSKYIQIYKLNDNSCYTKLMISNDDDYSIKILQKLFITLPILFVISKESLNKLINHLYGIIYIQYNNQDDDLSYFSILFPLLCESCCIMYVDINMQTMIMNEILELFETVANKINKYFNIDNGKLISFLDNNIELLSIFHITSFTYLLLLDIHFFINKNEDNNNKHCKINLNIYACKAGNFLACFLKWCSKYEDNYILYYCSYCITNNIKELIDKKCLNNNDWMIESIKYLFIVMIHNLLNNKNNDNINNKDKIRRREELLEDFLRSYVISNNQIYSFICIRRIIDGLCNINEDNIIIDYFEDIINIFNKRIIYIIEDNNNNNSKLMELNNLINFSHIRYLLLFLPYKLISRLEKNINLILKNIQILIFNIDKKNLENQLIIPNIDLEIYFCSNICILYYILSIRSIFHFNIDIIEDDENNTYINKCVIYKILIKNLDNINNNFTKLIEFYDNKNIYNNQYNDYFSMFITVLEYIGSFDSKMNDDYNKKNQKLIKLFTKENLGNFYKNNKHKNQELIKDFININKNIPYHDILNLIRFGIINNNLNKHSFKYNDIVNSLRALRNYRL